MHQSFTKTYKVYYRKQVEKGKFTLKGKRQTRKYFAELEF